VIHVGIDTMNPGEVYVKFAEVEGGKKAMQGLNGRFFGGQMITAEPVSDAMYNTRFPKSVV
jgi:RNA-binding protein 39